MDWTFWFYWIMATTIGWIAGNMFSSAISVVISGVAIAVMQSVALAGRIHKAWRWGIASATSWIIGYIAYILAFSSNTGALLGTLLGLVVGISQWVILRNEFEWAGWWIIISMLAWTTGITVIPGLLSSGALPGALTGITLVILFRFSSRRKPENLQRKQF